jgi:hypothetical protein
VPLLGMLILCGLVSHQIVGRVCICYPTLVFIIIIIIIITDLQNEIKIVQEINKDINMNFGLEKCARIFLKKGWTKARCIHV